MNGDDPTLFPESLGREPRPPWQGGPDAEPYNLYDGKPPSEASSATSIAAGHSMLPHVGKLQRLVLLAISEAVEPPTDDDLERGLGLPHQTVSARRRELVLLKLIKQAGTRRNPSGRMAATWVKLDA